MPTDSPLTLDPFLPFLLTGALLLGALSLLRHARCSRSCRLMAAGLLFGLVAQSTTYGVIDYFTGAGINEAVLSHLVLGISGTGYSEMKPLLLVGGFAIALGGFLGYGLNRWLSRRQPHRQTRSGYWGLGLLCAALALHPFSLGLLSQWLQLRQNASDPTFATYYREPQLGPIRERPRNLVLIYAESLERTYFDETLFPGLIQELRALEASALRFTDIQQLWGTGWTMAGMVASQCGMPLVTTASAGEIFGHNHMEGMDRFLPKATCLGDLLAQRGYHLSYLAGTSTSFAGNGKFLTRHGFQEVHGREALEPRLPDPSYHHGWGLYDDSLLDLAWEQLARLSAAPDPFVLTVLTFDTHHPEGFPSASCKAHVYGSGDNPMLNAVHCADHLLSQFIRRILQAPGAENTLVALTSDHLSMRTPVWDQLNRGTRRDLWMMWGQGLAPAQMTQPGSPLDLGPTLLHQLGFSAAELGLGRDLLRSQPSLVAALPGFNRLLPRWHHDLRAFWDLPNLSAGVRVEADRQRVRIADREFYMPLLAQVTPDLALGRMMFGESWIVPFFAALPMGSPILWLDRCATIAMLTEQAVASATEFCAYAGLYGQASGSILPLTAATDLEPAWLNAAFQGSPTPEVYARQQLRLRQGVVQLRQAAAEPGSPSLNLLLRSQAGAGLAAIASADARVEWQEADEGLRLFGIDEQRQMQLLAQARPCASDTATAPPVHSQRDVLAVIAQGAWHCSETDAPQWLKQLPLRQWQNLPADSAYIGIVNLPSGQSQEFSAPPGTSLGVLR